MTDVSLAKATSNFMAKFNIDLPTPIIEDFFEEHGSKLPEVAAIHFRFNWAFATHPEYAIHLALLHAAIQCSFANHILPEAKGRNRFKRSFAKTKKHSKKEYLAELAYFKELYEAKKAKQITADFFRDVVRSYGFDPSVALDSLVYTSDEQFARDIGYNNNKWRARRQILDNNEGYDDEDDVTDDEYEELDDSIYDDEEIRKITEVRNRVYVPEEYREQGWHNDELDEDELNALADSLLYESRLPPTRSSQVRVKTPYGKRFLQMISSCPPSLKKRILTRAQRGSLVTESVDPPTVSACPSCGYVRPTGHLDVRNVIRPIPTRPKFTHSPKSAFKTIDPSTPSNRNILAAVKSVSEMVATLKPQATPIPKEEITVAHAPKGKTVVSSPSTARPVVPHYSLTAKGVTAPVQINTIPEANIPGSVRIPAAAPDHLGVLLFYSDEVKEYLKSPPAADFRNHPIVVKNFVSHFIRVNTVSGVPEQDLVLFNSHAQVFFKNAKVDQMVLVTRAGHMVVPVESVKWSNCSTPQFTTIPFVGRSLGGIKATKLRDDVLPANRRQLYATVLDPSSSTGWSFIFADEYKYSKTDNHIRTRSNTRKGDCGTVWFDTTGAVSIHEGTSITENVSIPVDKKALSQTIVFPAPSVPLPHVESRPLGINYSRTLVPGVPKN